MAHGKSHSPNADNAHKSSERRWAKLIIRMDGKPVGCRRVTCATDGCGQEGEVLDRTGDGLPPNVIQRRFENKGWEVGKSDKHDYCPSCVEKATIARRARRNGNKPLQLVPAQPAPQETQMPPEADTIAVATRDDNRTIFAKLQDVYIDETKGYMAPWTDQAVAKDLGCPLSWVQKIREENFGPARDNSEIRNMLDRVEANAHDATKVLEEARQIRAEGAALVARINDLNARITPIARNLDGLLATADRIAKAVSS